MAKSFDELAARTMSKAAIRRAETRAQEIIREMFIREIRQMTNLSQAEVARRLGMKQPSYSKMESKKQDMQVNTLRRVIESMGGHLDVLAHFPGGTVRVADFLFPDKSGTRVPVGTKSERMRHRSSSRDTARSPRGKRSLGQPMARVTS